MRKFFYLFFIGLTCQFCAQKNTQTASAGFRANPLPDSISIYFLQLGEPLPDKSEFVREIQIGHSLFSSGNCSYKALMNYAKFTARQSGANLIHLTEFKKPVALANECYQATAKLYKNLEGPELVDFENRRKSVNKSKLPESADYAMVYFYRPKNFEGAAISYNVRIDGKDVAGKASNGAKFEYKVTDFGKHKFSGKTRKQDSVTLEIEKGKEYYIRCGVASGPGIASPDLYVMDNYVARQEYEEL